MNKTLYQISDDIRDLERVLTDMEGDITGVEEIIDDWLLANQEQLSIKLDGYCALVRELEGRAAFRKEEATRLTALVKTDINAIDKLKWRLKIFFQMHQYDVVQTDRFRVKLATNGGVLPLIVKCEPEDLPTKYKTRQVTFKPDQFAIREDLDKGVPLKFAELGQRGQSIRIK